MSSAKDGILDGALRRHDAAFVVIDHHVDEPQIVVSVAFLEMLRRHGIHAEQNPGDVLRRLLRILESLAAIHRLLLRHGLFTVTGRCKYDHGDDR